MGMLMSEATGFVNLRANLADSPAPVSSGFSGMTVASVAEPCAMRAIGERSMNAVMRKPVIQVPVLDFDLLGLTY